LTPQFALEILIRALGLTQILGQPCEFQVPPEGLSVRISVEFDGPAPAESIRPWLFLPDQRPALAAAHRALHQPSSTEFARNTLADRAMALAASAAARPASAPPRDGGLSVASDYVSERMRVARPSSAGARPTPVVQSGPFALDQMLQPAGLQPPADGAGLAGLQGPARARAAFHAASQGRTYDPRPSSAAPRRGFNLAGAAPWVSPVDFTFVRRRSAGRRGGPAASGPDTGGAPDGDGKEGGGRALGSALDSWGGPRLLGTPAGDVAALAAGCFDYSKTSRSQQWYGVLGEATTAHM
jgi:hypothetical protein